MRLQNMGTGGIYPDWKQMLKVLLNELVHAQSSHTTRPLTGRANIINVV